MKTIRRESLSEQVLNSIIEYIRENKLVVGDRLPTEEELSRRLKVSRTSVREAMKGLSMNGVVESIPGKGTFLRSPISDILFINSKGSDPMQTARTTIEDVMEVRTALEILAGEIAIDRGTDQEIASVGEALEDLTHAVEEGRPWAVEGTSFHVRIAQMSHNKILLQTIISLASTTSRYKDELYKHGQDMALSIFQHREIYDALKARNKGDIRRAIKAHMDSTRDDLVSLIDASNAEDFM